MEKRKNKYSSQLTKIEGYENTYIPQANDLNKIAVVIDILKHSCINEKDLVLALSFSTRQSLYYGDALRFLDLVETFKYGKHTMLALTEAALKYFDKGATNKNLRSWIIEGLYIDLYEKRISKDLNKEKSTYPRRVKSLNSWKKWVENE